MDDWDTVTAFCLCRTISYWEWRNKGYLLFMTDSYIRGKSSTMHWSKMVLETVCLWATVRMSWSLESSMPPTGLVKSIFLISWPLAMSQNLRVLSSPHEINLRSSVLNKACLIPAVWPERSYQYQVPVLVKYQIPVSISGTTVGTSIRYHTPLRKTLCQLFGALNGKWFHI